MRGFIYTLLALVLSILAISILFIGQNIPSQDSYPLYLMKDRLNYNVLDLNNIDISYDNGLIINDSLPHGNLSLQLNKLKMFYSNFTNYNVSFNRVNHISLIGPINYAEVSKNKTRIEFNSNSVLISIISNCSFVNETINNGTTNYEIKVYNSSNLVYSLSGKYNGVINCSSFYLNFNDNSIVFEGSGKINYKFNVSRGIFLSNIKYLIKYKDSNINSIVRIRI